MLEMVTPSDGAPCRWSIETKIHEDGSVSVVRIIGERATEPIHARQARVLAGAAMERLGVNELIAFQAQTIISELGANAVKYGGALTELDVVWTPARGERQQETLDIGVVNPSVDVEGTPGINHRGELAADEPNYLATHGRGLQIVDEYTEHRWGQSNDVDAEGRPIMITHAVLYGARSSGLPGDEFDEVA